MSDQVAGKIDPYNPACARGPAFSTRPSTHGNTQDRNFVQMSNQMRAGGEGPLLLSEMRIVCAERV